MNNINPERKQRRAYSVFNNNDDTKKHYNVRILKYQPTKVLINGRLKDRMSLSAEEREAVRTQEEINKLRAELKQQNELRQKKL